MAKKKATTNRDRPASNEKRGTTRFHYLVLAFFFMSGITGLIYEILWTRMITKIIGGAPYAVSIVLTVFMGGLGLGSYLAGRYIDRLKSPGDLVRTYGILELFIGGYGLVLPILLFIFRPLYAVLYNHMYEYSFSYNLLTFAGCALILLPPVICMGATLPVLSRYYVNGISTLGASLGRLYSINTVGGALGSLVCGFWIINLWGIWGSLAFAMALNVIIGFAGIYIGSRIGPDGVAAVGAAKGEPASAAREYARKTGAAALLVFAVSGFCSMAYEVIWTKLLGLVVGPTTYSFTLILVTFITGLALGSVVFGWLADRTGKPGLLLILSQLAAASSALVVSQLLGNSQAFFAKLIFTFKDDFSQLMLAKSLTIFAFMLFPTFFSGAAFPLVGKLYTSSLASIGRSIGFAYSLNTLGAVLGSFSAGFLMIPLMGKEHSLGLLAAIQLASAVAAGMIISVNIRRRTVLRVSLAGVALLGFLALAFYPHWDRRLLATGRYQRFDGQILNGMDWLEALFKGRRWIGLPASWELVYFGDGIGGFTTVMRYPDGSGEYNYTLYNSGKPDASTVEDMPTQMMLAHFPMLLHPRPRQVLVIGMASGITAGEILHYPVDRLDLIDINRQVVAASRFFRPWNNNVLSNPRTRLIIQDGRAHLELTRETYDVIVSEPSNPWMAGLATLYTRDFFDLVRNRLNDGGIFVQWVHSYQMDWDTFSMIGRTFQKVYPDGILVRTSDVTPDFLLIGFKGPRNVDLGTMERNFIHQRKSRNMVLPNPVLLYQNILCEDLARLFGEGPLHTDNHPRLEYSAPKLMYHEDTTVLDTLRKNRFLTNETRDLIRGLETNIDAQIDRAILTLSMDVPVPDMVNLSGASPEQKARYEAILTEYCSLNAVEDFSFVSDPELKALCISVQIGAMKEKIGAVNDKARLFTHLANLYSLLKMNDEAIRYYQMSIDANPEYEVPYFNLGIILSERNRHDEAVSLFEKAAQFSPYNSALYHSWGYSLYRIGRLDDAAARLERAIALDPDFSPTRRMLADVYTARGNNTEARKQTQEAERIEQGHGKP